ncbi:MAG TPA: hypothetical protein VH234_01350 [Candidatus Saccharimonadales bacterium]|jgi:hypothetical protein|nr:hypothetical protein [Candidatus Saccharimonadales bacterium]
MYAIIFHAHQKLDRVAHRQLEAMLPADSFFPSIKQVLKFEAGHGPDGARLKRGPTGTQPWHFINPFDETDTELHQQVEQHYQGLVKELVQRDSVRSAFEAAWLAHALVDGLTPAHHYPYEEELERLRGGEPYHTRKGIIGRAYVKSDTIVSTIHRSLKLIGPRGLLTSHAMFEAGAYAIIAPLKLAKAPPTAEEVECIIDTGLIGTFQTAIKEVAKLNIYGRFCADGWIRPVIKDIRDELAPRMVSIITLAWYAAAQEAAKVSQ